MHADYHHDWGTPEPWATWLRYVTKGIDTDPCTADHHQDRIQAPVSYYHSGLERPWFGTVYVNGPGENSSGAMAPWWDRAMAYLNGEPEELAGICDHWFDSKVLPCRHCDACHGALIKTHHKALEMLPEPDADPVRSIVWCLFNPEHQRCLKPSVWTIPGLLVMPGSRVGFHQGTGPVKKSPRNWAQWWLSKDAIRRWTDPPTPCEFVETGIGLPTWLPR